jgi:hypothetical protein
VTKAAIAVRAAAIAVAVVLAGPAWAGPFLDPGDTGLRSAVQRLADAGLITAPVTTWPLAVVDVDVQVPPGRVLTDAEARALAHVRAAVRTAKLDRDPSLTIDLAGGADPELIRGFEDTPRARGEAGATFALTGNRGAVRLSAQVVADAEDDRTLRADGSYAAIALGNWAFAVSAQDRWWGPGWQGSLILSNNARPLPSLVIDRVATTPFESRWLRWIGAWDFVTLMGITENDRAVPNALVWGARLTVRPTRFLEAGFSRLAMWCGEDRPCDLGTFGDVILGRDNAGDNVNPEDEPGNQQAGYDLRLSGAPWGIPLALYAQRIGEDEQDFFPSLFLTQLGVEAWGSAGRFGNWRLYLEAADTLCGGNFDGSGLADCAYNHPIYATGLRYRGRTLGHAADSDAELYTLGVVLTGDDSRSWLLSASTGDLNRVGAVPEAVNPVATEPTDYLSLRLVHRRRLPFGALQFLAGVESFETDGGGTDRDVRVSVGWRYPE